MVNGGFDKDGETAISQVDEREIVRVLHELNAEGVGNITGAEICSPVNRS